MLYLIRHCSTLENEKGILCSNKDSELSKNGLREGELLSKWFDNKKVDLILTSNFLRAKQTANFVSNSTGAPISVSTELAERNVGSAYSNLLLNELKKIRSEKFQSYYDPTQDWNSIEDVESDNSVFNRVKYLLELNYQSGQNIVCVTHAGVIKSFLHIAFKIDTLRSNAFKVKNGCILVFQNENNFEHIQLLGMYQINQ